MRVESAFERGDLPRTAEEFAAWKPLVVRHQALAREPDKVVLQHLAAWMRERIARTGASEGHVAATVGRDYVEARAQAFLMGAWQAVPLMLDRVLVAVIHHGEVIAVRKPGGTLALHPDRRTFGSLRDSAESAENLTLFIRDLLEVRLDSEQHLVLYAETLWRAARKYHSYWWRHLTEEVDRAD